MGTIALSCVGVGTWCGTSTQQYLHVYFFKTNWEYALGTPCPVGVPNGTRKRLFLVVQYVLDNEKGIKKQGEVGR